MSYRDDALAAANRVAAIERALSEASAMHAEQVRELERQLAEARAIAKTPMPGKSLLRRRAAPFAAVIALFGLATIVDFASLPRIPQPLAGRPGWFRSLPRRQNPTQCVLKTGPRACAMAEFSAPS